MDLVTREIQKNQKRLSKWGWKGDITDSIIDISDLDYDELRKKGKASDSDWRIENWFDYSDRPDKVLVNPSWYNEYDMNDLFPPDWVEVSPKFVEGRYDISHIHMAEGWNSGWKSKELDKIESDLGISFDDFIPMGKSIGKSENRYCVIGIGERRDDAFHPLPDVEKYLAALIIPYDDNTGVCIIRNDVMDRDNLVKDVSEFRQQYCSKYDVLNKDKWVQNYEQTKSDLKTMQEKLDSLAVDKGLVTEVETDNEDMYE